jgi:hypothetical protein
LHVLVLAAVAKRGMMSLAISGYDAERSRRKLFIRSNAGLTGSNLIDNKYHASTPRPCVHMQASIGGIASLG